MFLQILRREWGWEGRRGGRDRGREISMRERNIDWLSSRMYHDQGSNLQSFWCVNHRARPGLHGLSFTGSPNAVSCSSLPIRGKPMTTISPRRGAASSSSAPSSPAAPHPPLSEPAVVSTEPSALPGHHPSLYRATPHVACQA